MTRWRVIRWRGLDTTRGWVKVAGHGAVAQLGERVVRNDEVVGSIPIGSTSFRFSGGPAGRFMSRPRKGASGLPAAQVFRARRSQAER